MSAGIINNIFLRYTHKYNINAQLIVAENIFIRIELVYIQELSAVCFWLQTLAAYDLLCA